jgi:hypothetical protein
MKGRPQYIGGYLGFLKVAKALYIKLAVGQIVKGAMVLTWGNFPEIA